MAEMHPARQLIGKFLAVGLLAAHLLVIGMAMSPALHHWLHGDADESDHQCAVTAMVHGQFDQPEIPYVEIPQPLLADRTGVLLSSAQPLLDFRPASPSGRAPPLA